MVARKEEVEIFKPLTDNRGYRRIVLPNALEVLIITDPDTDKAAASMDVSVGNFSDPDGLDGLAHFLEHMLFYASEKYPLEDSYSKYIAEHGGMTNAFTSSEHTNFFFDVNNGCFEEALDRFAQFFIKPLMSPDATLREIKAVDSENQKNILSDAWRMSQLQKHLCAKGHPYHKFSTGWATSLSAGEGEWSYKFSFFQVVIDLTDAGHDHMRDIVGLLFKYIILLQKSGVQKWIFDELSAISETEFHYKDKIPPSYYVVGIASSMRLFPPEDWLVGDLPRKFVPATIQMVLDELTPDNVRIFWESKKFEGSTGMVEPWYGTAYSVEKIAGATIQQWVEAAPDVNLHLPSPNVFIPTDLALKDVQEKAKFPVLLRKSAFSKLWYKPDTMFLTPKAYVKIDFNCPQSSFSPEAEILTDIFARLLMDYLTEEAYDAQVAGLDYRIDHPDAGFQVTVIGYNHKMRILVEAIVGKIAQFEVKPDRFSLIKVHQDDLRLNVILQLFVLIAKQQAFYQLRTVEQLGYITFLAHSIDSGINGVHLVVQSTIKDPAQLDSRVEAFLQTFESKLCEMAYDEFKSNVNALIDMKLEKNKNLVEESSNDWAEIVCGTLKFDRMESEVAALREVTQQELIDFFNKHIKVGAPHRKSLKVQVYGGLHNAEFQAAKCNTGQPQSVYINDIFSFRRSQPLYGSLRGGFGHMKL
ncbi:hypothetical protein MRB53_012253 [Persea americana]|uniref:Uncharacterized protein n=1 Tax=Persea americana TaxID=3435 RepID=A0ACC2LY37_PERAE|nr:hypothetical protein MRB53_012253 [Persea americana]